MLLEKINDKISVIKRIYVCFKDEFDESQHIF